MFHVKTNPKDNYGGTWLSTKDEYFEFNVQACWEARVAMFSKFSSEGLFVYEVILGAAKNSELQIWDSRNISVPVFTMMYDSLLSCYEQRQFWIKWENGKHIF